MFAVTLIAALLATSPQSASPNWRMSSGGPTTKSGATNYIDTNSIQRTGSTVRFWREIRFNVPQTAPDGMQFDRIATHIEADCTAITFRSITQRARMGTTMVTEFASDRPARAIEPNTSGMRDLRAACFNEWRPGS